MIQSRLSYREDFWYFINFIVEYCKNIALVAGVLGVLLVTYMIVIAFAVKTLKHVLAILMFNYNEGNIIHGIYNTGNSVLRYTLKFALFYSLLLTRKLIRNIRTAISKQARLYERERAIKFDNLQILPDFPLAADAVFFQAANKDGFYIVASIARRSNQMVNSMLMIKIPGLELIVAPWIPNCTLLGNNDSYKVNGLEITPIEPLKIWKVTYCGPAKFKGQKSSFITLKLCFKFESSYPFFDYDRHISLWALASAVAREPWSRDYFRNFNEQHQRHFEQFGSFTGTISALTSNQLNVEYEHIKMDCMRDHTLTRKRDWSKMHRYILHTIHSETFRIVVGVVCLPVHFTQLTLGFMCNANKAIHPIDWCDLKLYNIGEKGNQPAEYGFEFKSGGETFHVYCEIEESLEVSIDKNTEGIVIESMCKFVVNGKAEAWGFTEWYYSKKSSPELS